MTPMQMATAYARDRQRRHPAPAAHHRRRSAGKPSPLPRGRRVDLGARPRAEVRDDAARACSAPGGTASEVSIPGYELAGKTGTASKIDPDTGEYSNTGYVASFVGFAPAQQPEAADAR